MLAILSSVDEGQKAPRDEVSFVHILSTEDPEIELEARPLALAFARATNKEKVYLFYGEKGKIIYECPL